MTRVSLLAATVMLGGTALAAADWPQWQGPDRTRISRETGLLKEWPTGGPRVIWTANNLGTGYGSMAVAGDRVFLQGARGQNSVVIALNRADGKEVWARPLGPIETRMRTNMGAGPRGTPTVDGDRLYVLTENGDLACLKTDGSSVWQLNILKEFGGSQLQWLISESPLVDGPHVVVSPGGPGAGIVKLDKMTGKTVWTSRELSDTAGYSSITVADVQGVRTYMTFTAQAGVGVRASDGKLMFRYPKAANGVANIATPIFSNNKVFFTSGYGAGGGLLDLNAKDGEVVANEVYHTTNMRNHHGGVVLVDGYMYGFSDLILTCLEFTTGSVMWRDRSVGKGSVTYADGHLYIQSENNVVGLAEATPSGYREKGRFEIPAKGQLSWAHPVISDGRLYVRNQDTLLVYDIKPAAQQKPADPPATSGTKAEQEVINLSKDKWRWMSERNVDALAGLFHEGAVFVHMGGTMSRSQELEVIKSGGIHYKNVEIQNVSVRVIGTTAILLNRIRLVAVVGGNEVTNPFVVTEVYVQQGGTWKLGSLSFTRLTGS